MTCTWSKRFSDLRNVPVVLSLFPVSTLPRSTFICYSLPLPPIPPSLLHPRQLLELYTLLKSLSGVFEACQSATAPSAPTAMQHMLLLLASDLNCSKPLELHEPSHYFSRPSAQAAAPAWVDGEKEVPSAAAAKAARVVKAPEDLTEVRIWTKNGIGKRGSRGGVGGGWGGKGRERMLLRQRDDVLPFEKSCVYNRDGDRGRMQ